MTKPTGKPKGRPPKNPVNPVDQEYNPDTETTINEPPPIPNVKVKQNGKFTVSELAEKMNILLGGAAKISGYEYQYEADHYKQEAAGLLRLIEKYPIIGKGVTLFDPILIVLGIIGKFKNLVKKPKEDKKQPPPKPGVYGVDIRNTG